MRLLARLVLCLATCAVTAASYITRTRTIAGIVVPDTHVIRKAISYARQNMDDHTYNHVMRSWLTGQASISHLNGTQGVDLEAFAVSAILHDLGWSHNSRLISKDKRFEVDGAIAAREFLLKEGGPEWTERRIQLVWDAIALHTSRDIALYKESEVWMTSLGVMAELIGPAKSQSLFGRDRIAVTQQEFEAIAKEFPRTGLREFFRGVMIGLCTSKPATTYTNFMADYGERFVEGYSTEGKRVIDLLESSMIDDV